VVRDMLGWCGRKYYSFRNSFRHRPILAGLLLALFVSIGVFVIRWGVQSQWELALEDVRNERPFEARSRLDYCRKVWPRNSEVCLLSARVARVLGDVAKCESLLHECIKLDGGASEGVQLEFFLLRTQSGEVDELAPRLFQLVESNHPDSRMILQTVSRAYIVRLRYRPAFASLSKWIEVEPGIARPYHWRGWVLERMNNPKAAMEDYLRALDRDPKLDEVRLRLAEMFLEDKQAPEALPLLTQLMQERPDNPVVRARLGSCLFLQGRSSEARQLLESALAELPKDPTLLSSLASLELQDGNAAAAERFANQILATDESDTEALFLLSSAYQQLGRIDEAKNALRSYQEKRAIVDRINDLLKDATDTPNAHADDYAEIGQSFLKIGREKFGVYWLEQALERDATCQKAHQAFADYYEAKGDATNADLHRRQLRPTSNAKPAKP
jgi:tetratricopeptide (TPR) repeat protein